MNLKKCNGYEEMSNEMVIDFLEHMKQLLNEKDFINIAIATGFTLELFIIILRQENIPFHKINLYIVDEYAGISFLDPQSCSSDLFKLFGSTVEKFNSIKCFSIHNYKNEIDVYHKELSEHGLDICILGVGEDGHVGFCYPPIKRGTHRFYEVLKLSENRKHEHFLKGWFPSLNAVPDYVITLSLWGISQSSIIMVGAIYEKKKYVITRMLRQDVPVYQCPILYLLNHKNFTLYLG